MQASAREKKKKKVEKFIEMRQKGSRIGKRSVHPDTSTTQDMKAQCLLHRGG